MTAVEVRAISLPKGASAFLKTWAPIYADDPMWVPPLYMDKKKFLDPTKNPYFKIATVQCFMAYQNGRAVGTIAATVDHDVQKNEPGLAMFGFYEFIDDEAVSSALWKAAVQWMTEQGMTRARGPYNLSPNHDFGLLIDGFDTPPTIANPHGRTYYQRHYEALGLTKVMDWYAYWMDAGDPPRNIVAIADRFMSRNPEFHIREVDLANFDREVELFWEIYNDAWEDNWGHVEFTREEFMFTAAGLKSVLEPSLSFFLYKGDECVAASITLPDFNQLIKKADGKILPFGWYHLLFNRKSIDQIRIFVLGVKKEYQRLPLGAPLYAKTWENGMAYGIKGGEASLILENNHRMRGALEKLGARIYKTYRSYEIPLQNE